MSFADHITVVDIKERVFTDSYVVTIYFDTDPSKLYEYDIERKRFKPTKEAIAKEILKQVKDSS